MGGHCSHELGMHGWIQECKCVQAVIGVMSKRLAAAGLPGASRCPIFSRIRVDYK